MTSERHEIHIDGRAVEKVLAKHFADRKRKQIRFGRLCIRWYPKPLRTIHPTR